MDLLLRLVLPLVIVGVVALLWWVGRAVAEGAREGLAEAREEAAADRLAQAASQAQARLAVEERAGEAAARLSLEQRQALSLRAPFTEIWLDLFPHQDDLRDLELFYRLTPPAGQEHELASSLRDGWEITDTASATEKIGWLLNSGHRAEYDLLRQALQSGQRPAGAARETAVVERWEPLVGAAGAAAFDLARAVDIAAQACALGYLSESQTWKVLHHCRALARDRFSDWGTYGQSFLAGAEFWKSGGLLNAQMHKRYAAAVDWLQTDPHSPWVREPLDTVHPEPAGSLPN